MAAFGARLVTAAPHRPVQDSLGSGWGMPDECPEQAPDLGDGEGQQVHCLRGRQGDASFLDASFLDASFLDASFLDASFLDASFL